MTENLLQKLEEKMMMLLTEVEEKRKGMNQLSQENAALKAEREKYIMDRINHEKKLQDLLSLFEAVKPLEAPVVSNLTAVKPVLIQG